MPMLVRAFPVLPGKEDLLRAFVQEMAGARRQEAAEFYRSFDVLRESWHLQNTLHGAWVIGVTEVDAPLELKAREYAASDRPFDRWFKDQVRHLSGIDPDFEPLGPPTETLFEFDRSADPATGERPAFVATPKS
jgi:hypothetical protein